MNRTFYALLAVVLLGASFSALASPIRIESGTYGANCGARHGNSTRTLALHCNARETCRYPVASPEHTFDAKACRSDFVAEWYCGSGEFHRAVVRAVANDAGTLVMSCEQPTGAGK
ncbi:conserved exported hypothetical protein [Paraburkholderia tropica]|nr:conserved exported hypothetical protein [Paraburkholderia tropica]